jgi:hypothetical protein
MRTILLLPLTALVAVVAGCGSEAREQAVGSVPERDLTLVTQAAQVEIASPVEMKRPQVQHQTVRPSRLARAPRSTRAAKVEVADVWVAAPVLATPQPVAQPASTASTPNDRELLPGKTVTLIPTSNGPSPGSERADELPAIRGRTMGAHGGGTCRGGRRGPGIGIAAAPRPDFR